MPQVGESKSCVIFTVNKRKKIGFMSTDLYAFDEFFVKLEDEQRKNKSAKKNNKPACPINTIYHYHSYASFATINSLIYRVGGSFYSDVESRLIWTEYCKMFRYGSPDDLDTATAIANRCYEGSTRVELCDMVDDPCNWNGGPRLNFPRRHPHLLVLGGRLYAAGGFLQMPEDFSFMEMLDQGADSWDIAPNPPVGVEQLDYFLSASVDEMGVIFIVTGREFPCAYTYIPDKRVWQPFDDIKFDKDMVFDYHARPAVVVGKILLWIDDHQGTAVFGVDLSTRRYFGFDIAREGFLHTPCFPNDFPRLVHFGNDELCLLWRDTHRHAYKCQDGGDDTGNEETFCVGYHCVKFCISLDQCTRGKPCNLKVISRKKCIAPASPHKFQDAFVVDVAIPKNNRRHSIPSSTLWGFWGSLSMIALVSYFQVMRR